MDGLQRSAMSFRRQGSSGLVWDDKLLSGEINRQNRRDQAAENKDQLDVDGDNANNNLKPINLERSQSNGGGRGYRTGRVAPAVDPPSPRVSACGFCSAFKKPAAGNKKRRATPGKRAAR